MFQSKKSLLAAVVSSLVVSATAHAAIAYDPTQNGSGTPATYDYQQDKSIRDAFDDIDNAITVIDDHANKAVIAADGAKVIAQDASDNADTAKTDAADAKTAAGAAQTTADAAAAAATANIGAIAGKVDQTAYDIDQQRQDDALTDAITKQAATDGVQDTDINDLKNSAGRHTQQIGQIQQDVTDAKDDFNQFKGNVSGALANAATVSQQNHTAITDEVTRATTAEQTNAAGVAANKTASTANTTGVAANKAAIQTETADRQAAATGLQAQVDHKVDTTTFTQRSAVVDTRFADTQQRIDDNKAQQSKVNKAVADTLDNHEGRITTLENQNNKQFANLKNEIQRNEKKANAGTSTALAATGIPQVMADQNFALGAAVGGYEGESAVAVGFSARVTHSVVVKASVGTDTQRGVGYTAGVAVGW
ncbi:hypothetical protein E1C95_22680 [Salmonella enterica subsp. enterica serovar Bonariensis]|nr:hypothetical protein [Salmonella enterica subsp. enterica serovar Bonariensis]